MGAGAGLDGAIAARVHGQRTGKKLGIASYVIPVARTVFFETLPKTTVTVDGSVLCQDAEYVVIGNCRESSGIFAATPEAEIDDGLLDVCVMRGLTVAHVLQLIWAVLRPGFSERPYILYRKARTVKLSPSGPDAARLQIDGDPAGFIPATFHILPKALSVVTGGLVGVPARLDDAVCQRVASSAS
jgi:diacylglycerol kinase family enzyme